MKKLFYILFLTAATHVLSGPVKILTKDEQILVLDMNFGALKLSGTIKNVLDDIDDNDIIPLPYISKKIFSNISACLEILASNVNAKKQKELITKLLENFEAQDLYDFIEGTSYLDIPFLLEIACKIWYGQHTLTLFEKNINLNFDNPEINEIIRKVSLKAVRKLYRLDYLKHFPPKQHSELMPPEAGIVIVCCDFNPVDNTLATSSPDGIIRIWDVSLGKCLQEFENKDDRNFIIRYDSNGQTIISSSFDKEVGILNLNDKTLDIIKVESTICSLDVNHRNIAVGLCDGHIKVYNILTENFTDLSRIHRSNVSSICYNLDGSLLASGEISGVVALWDINNQNFRIIHKPDENPSSAIRSIIFGPSQTLVWGLENGDIYFYNIIDHTFIKKNATGCVNSLSYNDQLKLIASGHDNGNGSRIFDAQSGKLLHILQDIFSKCIVSVSFSKHKNILAVSGPIDGTKIWKLAKHFNALEKATPNQLKLLALAKLKSKEHEILDLTKNSHLLKSFESLSSKNQALLAHVTNVKLDLRKKLLLKIIAHKNLLPITLRDLALCANFASQSYMVMQRRHLFFEPVQFLLKKLDI